MTSPLIERLSTELDYPVLDLGSIDTFLAQHAVSVLFFTEDAQRFPESNDVAVVLPELIRAFPQLQPAVIGRQDEKKLQQRYGFMSWPALVFMRGEQYLNTITGIKDWGDYLTEIRRIIDSPASRPPSVGVAVVSH